MKCSFYQPCAAGALLSPSMCPQSRMISLSEVGCYSTTSSGFRRKITKKTTFDGPTKLFISRKEDIADKVDSFQNETSQIPSTYNDNKKIMTDIASSDDSFSSLNPSAPVLKNEWITIFLLNFVAVIWGTQHSVIKLVLSDEDISSAGFTLARFSLALLTVLPFTPNIQDFFNDLPYNDNNEPTSILERTKPTTTTQENKSLENDEVPGGISSSDNALAWRWGLEMGLWMFLGYAFQAVGLLFTTAQRSGFLLYLNVKFVPFFAYVIFQRQISALTWLSALVAFSGTILLSYDGSPLNYGDAWSIAAAMSSAMFILRLETASKSVKDSSRLNAASLWTVTVLSFIWCIINGYISPETSAFSELSSMDKTLQQPFQDVISTVSKHPIAIIYLSVVTTALTNYLQTVAQKGVAAERASVIYALDPVYGAFFANLILGETLGMQGIFGAGLIVVAAAFSAFADQSQDQSSEK